MVTFARAGCRTSHGEVRVSVALLAVHERHVAAWLPVLEWLRAERVPENGPRTAQTARAEERRPMNHVEPMEHSDLATTSARARLCET